MTATFRDRVRRALADPALQQALDRNAERRRAAWVSAFASLPSPSETRARAADIRRRNVDDLPRLTSVFLERLRQRGVVVHQAATAEDACRVIVGLLRQRRAQRVVKAKSMVTEEIGLNRALAAAGIGAIETDLGEFIVQLRGEPPAHITAPAIHLRREDVARTFETHLGMPFTTEVEAMTAAARRALRTKFFEAQAGISGVNFGVAETGTMCLVTNEGNGRMVTTLPPLHIAVMGAERLVETSADLAVMLEVLPRAGTGQRRTSYISLLQGPRGRGDPDGPEERHLVLVDNGRLALLGSQLAESLACIRCGACLNACPVYQEIGGHAYASTYPGPIGSVVSPGLWGQAAFGHLATASTLCGACREACPVGIDLPGLLLRVRADRVEESRPPLWLRRGMQLLGAAIAGPGRYHLALRLASAASRLTPKRDGWIRRMPPPLSRWTDNRDLPPFAPRPFRDRWPGIERETVAAQEAHAAPSAPPPAEARIVPVGDLRQRFVAAAMEAGCEVIECSASTLPELLHSMLRRERATEVLCWGRDVGQQASLFDQLAAAGVRLLRPELLSEEDGSGRWERMADSPVGLTLSVAGLADAGTIIVPSGPGRPLAASLLPPIHMAILREEDLYESLEAWLPTDGTRWIARESAVILITGPSRTADIEMTLTVGVHGPGRVVVFLVGKE